MEWMSAKKKDEYWSIPERWLHIHYYEALNILFRFENALRIFVYVVLKCNLGKDWDLTDLGNGTTIRTETKKRITQGKDYGYLCEDVTSPMLYLNGGELIQIICSDNYWKYFKKYFRASKAIVTTKLQEIATIRNSLAHFRPIVPSDVDVAKQNAKHVLMDVEKCLVEITSLTNATPTNCPTEWYTEISKIESKGVCYKLFSTRNQNWIRATLIYSNNTISQRGTDAFIFADVTKVRVDQLLDIYPKLRDLCIYLAEHPHHGVVRDGKVKVMTQLSFVFEEKTLIANLGEIIPALKELCNTLAEETELVCADTQALGTLIEIESISARITGPSEHRYWTVETDKLQTKPGDITSVEYWGVRGQYREDFISATTQYPWMASEVSKEELPF